MERICSLWEQILSIKSSPHLCKDSSTGEAASLHLVVSLCKKAAKYSDGVSIHLKSRWIQFLCISYILSCWSTLLEVTSCLLIGQV